MLESKKIVPLQVSKWVKIPFLVDVCEMEDLIYSNTPPFKLYDVQRITQANEGIYEPSYFLERYGAYIEELKKGIAPAPNEYRGIFSSAWSVTDDAIFSMPAQEGRCLLKASKPVIQTQLNQIRYSEEEGTFRTQVFSGDSISWGIQAGFPHIYLDPETFEAGNTRSFPNMPLFLAIQRWIRKETVPTPFLINGNRINSPIRLGKKCFSWIASHPQLLEKGIAIAAR